MYHKAIVLFGAEITPSIGQLYKDFVDFFKELP